MRAIALALLLFTQGAQAELSLPPVGRSMFDYLVHRNGGQLPTSVADLRSMMKRLCGSPVAMVLQPDSRSSQRLFADDAHPRVLGVGDELRQSARARNFAEVAMRPQAEQIFFAYAERMKTLEIISYNPNAGRNEFQFIRNFGQPNAELLYVRRELCLKCHLEGTPIFSRFPWSDTDQVEAVAGRLRQAIGSHEYQSVPIGLAKGFALTRQVEAAARQVTFRKAWAEGFSGNAREARELLLANVLGFETTAEDAAPFTLLPTVFVPLPQLPDRRALPRRPGDVVPAVEASLKARPFLLAHLTPLNGVGSLYPVQQLAIYAQEAFGADFRRTLGSLVHHPMGREWAKFPELQALVDTPTAPSSYALHRALLTHFRPTEVPLVYLTDLDAAMPAPVLAEDGANEVPCGAVVASVADH